MWVKLTVLCQTSEELIQINTIHKMNKQTPVWLIFPLRIKMMWDIISKQPNISLIDIKARIGNSVQKLCLLYWVKWSFYSDSYQYIMCFLIWTKKIRSLYKLQNINISSQSSWDPRAKRANRQPSSLHLLCPSPSLLFIGCREGGRWRWPTWGHGFEWSSLELRLKEVGLQLSKSGNFRITNPSFNSQLFSRMLQTGFVTQWWLSLWPTDESPCICNRDRLIIGRADYWRRYLAFWRISAFFFFFKSDGR